MPQFHPDQSLLIEYASGSLDRARAIGVAVHLEFCPACRAVVQRCNAVGGELLRQQASPVSEGLLAATLARIDGGAERPAAEVTPTVPAEVASLPTLVQKLVAGTVGWRWRRLSGSLRTARLRTGQKQYEVSLFRIGAGGRVPMHDHRGEEYTVVLQGGFSDRQGLYQPGDFLFRGPGDVHQPQGLQHEDCVCLSVVSDRIRLRSPLDWLLAPWLRIRPM